MIQCKFDEFDFTLNDDITGSKFNDPIHNMFMFECVCIIVEYVVFDL